MPQNTASEAAAKAVQPIQDWARSHVAEPVSRTLNAIEKVPSSSSELGAAASRAERSAKRLLRKYGLKK